jgi:hypothetical protein
MNYKLWRPIRPLSDYEKRYMSAAVLARLQRPKITSKRQSKKGKQQRKALQWSSLGFAVS